MGEKHILVLLVLFIFSFACSNPKEQEDQVVEIPLGRPFEEADLIRFPPSSTIRANGVPLIIFEEMLVDFGTVEEGTQVEQTFTFQNPGQEPLLLLDVRSSCGCTIASWPKQPIAPNESGTIFVQFNTTGRSGPQQKVVTLTTNSEPSEYRLLLSGQVTERKPEN